MVRKTVVRRMALGDDGDATLKKQYKDLMKTEMLLVATALQDEWEALRRRKSPSNRRLRRRRSRNRNLSPSPSASSRKSRRMRKRRKRDDDESLDDEEIARREKEPHKDDHKFEKVPSEWKDRYADVAWVESQGFEHWPSIIYDPRWTKGNINTSAMKYLRGRSTCACSTPWTRANGSLMNP